ncbi:MAG: 1,4-dihydroxy-2-naphthoate octaprenyltransferase [Bacteroidia bacterium]|nr:1,4-dihydroxy-2-naphthoate octaprenyltransferase [Bacteroidia bacterium]
MSKINLYFQTFRLRTLPLSMSSIVLGIMMAAVNGFFNLGVCILTVITTLFLQILCNIANELGDAQKGTDTADRQGPAYVLTSGALTEKDFYHLIYTFVALSCISGLILLWLASVNISGIYIWLMLALGTFAIVAAIFYTMGKRPYGYRGFGDISVFIFFGLLGTLGSYFLQAGNVELEIILPASACGLLSVGVLNVNNIRDMETDSKNRITIPILLGETKAKIYHTILIVGGQLCFVTYNIVKCETSLKAYMYLFMLPIFIFHIISVWKLSGKALDKQLPLLVISTLIECLAFGGSWMLLH